MAALVRRVEGQPRGFQQLLRQLQRNMAPSGQLLLDLLEPQVLPCVQFESALWGDDSAETRVTVHCHSFVIIIMALAVEVAWLRG